MEAPIIRVEIGKEQLLSLPEQERIFFVALGHLQNEIDAINKLGYWVANLESNGEADEHGQFALNLLLSQFLAGKLREGWRLFETHFLEIVFQRILNLNLMKFAGMNLKILKSISLVPTISATSVTTLLFIIRQTNSTMYFLI